MLAFLLTVVCQVLLDLPAGDRFQVMPPLLEEIVLYRALQDCHIGRQSRHFLDQAIHQESDVIPENVDCIRALMGTEEDWKVSVAKTDSAISSYYGL